MSQNSFKKKVIVSLVAGSLVFQPVAPFLKISLADTTSSGVVQEVLSFEMGKVYEGFKLEKKMFSNDLNGDVYLFVHEKSGGQFIYVDAPDKNKWFSVTFRTPTVDSTGVNHIFEHAVLEGSEKFKVKSPFTEMGKRSVSTFMNAMTGYDYTYYPIASENDKDFDNLMRVYLDAVFAPSVLKNNKILQQEGWRYEVDPETGKLMFNGVVFNEMKGSMSEKYSVVFDDLKAALYPDTKYKFNSGGDPYHIVDLTHKELASKHAKYYQPSNAVVTVYGHMNVIEKMKYINDNYYSKYTKAAPIEDNKFQKPFEAAKNVKRTYPASPEATPASDSMLIHATALTDTSDKDRLGLSLLSMLLYEGENSPLYNEMIKSEMGMDVYAEFISEYYQPAFAFMLIDTSNESMAKFDAALNKILNDVVKNGFTKERLEGVFNLYEHSFKTGLLSADKGDAAISSINTGFVKYDDPLLALNQSKLLEEVKKEAFSSDYFQNLTKKYLLNNPHQVKMVFEPDAEYMVKLENKLEEKLNKRLKSMSKRDYANAVASIQSYNAWQEIPDSEEALNTLPSLKVSDLDLTARKNEAIETKISDVKTYKHPVKALGLSETTLYFDLKSLTQKELEYLDLFTAVLASGNTKNHTNEWLSEETLKYTTGISMSATSYNDIKNISNFFPYYVVKSNYNSESAEKISSIILERLTQTNFEDKDLIKTKLNEVVTGLQDEKVGDPNATIISRIKSTLTAQGAFNDIRLNQGYQTLVKANDNFDATYAETQKTLKSIYEKLFNSSALTVSIASDEKDYKVNETAIQTLIKGLKSEVKTAEKWNIAPKKEKVGFTIPSEVQYIQYGFNFNAFGEKATGADLVFASILSDGYMYENIRVKGGAYGGSMSIGMDGSVRFSTYMDPNLKTSVDAIERVIAYLKKNKPSQAEIDNAIISIAGRMENRSDVFTETSGDAVALLIASDPATRERIKKEILATKASDIDAFIAKLEKGLKNASIVVAGSKTQVDANKKLFDVVQPIKN